LRSMPMSSLKERVKALEADLRVSPMPLQYVTYRDLPFAIFCYAPSDEWAMRREIALLKTRLEKDTDHRVECISLAELLWHAVEQSEGIEAIGALEAQRGFDAAQVQVQDYLSDRIWHPLPGLLEARLATLDPNRHIAFAVRAGALAPSIYRVSKLLDEMKGKSRVPCVLFMPATTEGATLRFMGIAENEGRGSYHTKVYV
jgi:hypothetical protein